MWFQSHQFLFLLFVTGGHILGLGASGFRFRNFQERKFP